MTVSSVTRKTSPFTMSALITEYDFLFRALVASPENIKCKVVLTATGAITDLTYLTEYTVAVNADGVGGTVTVVDPLTSAYTLTIYRVTTNLQESDYTDYNQFPADTLENDIDKRTLISQENAEDTSRTLKLPITSTVFDLEVPEPSANKVLGWNTAGTGLENKSLVATGLIDVDTDGTLAANSDSKVASQKATKTYADTKQSALGFTPENSANKDTDGTLAANSDTKYTSQKAVKTYADGKISIPASSARGDILYYNGSVYTRLAKGTNGYFLKIGANDPEWAVGGIREYVAGSMVEYSLNTERTYTAGTRGSYHTLKDVKIGMRSGTVTVVYEAKRSGDDTFNTNIFVNDIAVGTERTPGDSYTEYTENISVSAGNNVQIKAKITGGSETDIIYIQNFKIKTDVVSIPFTVTDANSTE
jgi:hypothetical protein